MGITYAFAQSGISSLFGSSVAVISTESAGTIGALLSTVLPLLLMVGVFYFMLIRPQQKREKKTREMLKNIKVGDRITTIGGIFGRVAAIKDDVITIEVGNDKVRLMVARWAMRSVEGESQENELAQLGQ